MTRVEYTQLIIKLFTLILQSEIPFLRRIQLSH